MFFCGLCVTARVDWRRNVYRRRRQFLAYEKAGIMATKVEKPSLVIMNKEMASSSYCGIGSTGVSRPSPYAHNNGDTKSHYKMRITIPCPDVQSYIQNPKGYLPVRPVCPNNPLHRPHWNDSWERGLLPDHVHAIEITIFNAYCKQCHETISYWPEFVLPYQREPLETHEQVAIEHLQGCSIRESAVKIGYNPRTLSLWLKRILAQTLVLIDKVVSRILIVVGQEILPLTVTVAEETTLLLFAWLRNYAGWINFSPLYRLMGLCNILGKGDWDLWGDPLGRAKSRVKGQCLPG